MESSGKQTNETREELKKRLREKISSKRTGRTTGISRKKGEMMNESLKKISDVLASKNITNIDQIDTSLVETIMSIISKEDLELILKKIQDNSKFTELLNGINNIYNSSQKESTE